MIIIDTSGLLAWVDGTQHDHQRVVTAMSRVQAPYILSPFILAEIDYLLSTRVNFSAECAFLEEVGRGAYRLESFTASDIQRALAVVEKFGDLEVGLADASIVVLAERYNVRDVLTLDERHFRPLRTFSGLPFRLIPFDV